MNTLATTHNIIVVNFVQANTHLYFWGKYKSTFLPLTPLTYVLTATFCPGALFPLLHKKNSMLLMSKDIPVSTFSRLHFKPQILNLSLTLTVDWLVISY